MLKRTIPFKLVFEDTDTNILSVCVYNIIYFVTEFVNVFPGLIFLMSYFCNFFTANSAK